MTIVALDTSTLHNEGLFSAGMTSLARLARARRLRLAIPEMVRREYVSKLGIDGSGAVAIAARELRNARKRMGREVGVFAELGTLIARVSALSPTMEPGFDQTFQLWASRNHVEEIPLHHDLAGLVNAYFAGNGGFRSRKHREDFPDALIFSSLQQARAAEPNASFCVVSSDKGLRKALESFADTQVYGSVSELLAAAPVAALLAELDAQEHAAPILAQLHDFRFLARFEELLKAATVDFEEAYFDQDQIFNVENLGVGRIMSIYGEAPEPVEHGLSSVGMASYLGNDRYAVPFRIPVDVNLHFAMWMGDYYELPDERREELDLRSGDDDVMEFFEWGDGVVAGTAVVTVSHTNDALLTATSPQSLREALGQISFSFERLEL